MMTTAQLYNQRDDDNGNDTEMQSLAASGVLSRDNYNNNNNNNDHANHRHPALQSEYRDMACWYDRFWKSYLRQTLPLPLRLVQEYAQTQAKQRQQENGKENNVVVVVDVGCGTGEFFRRLMVDSSNQKDGDAFSLPESSIPATTTNSPAWKLQGVEPSAEMLQQAKTKLSSSSAPTRRTTSSSETRRRGRGVNRCHDFSFWEAPAEQLPLETESADIVVSTSAFHFFGDRPQALQEMLRILKSSSSSSSAFVSTEMGSHGGCLVITDWCSDYWLVQMYHWLERLRWNVWHGYDRPYPGPLTSQQLQRLVRDTGGFINIRIRTYRVRIFGIIYWGMQTLTATKK